MSEHTNIPSGFGQFWPYYLRAHMDPRTRAMHYVGAITGISLFTIGAVTGPWWLMPVALVAGYGISIPSHFLFEGNRPASLINPHWSFVSDFYMLGLFLTGRLGPEIERVKRLPDLAGRAEARRTDAANAGS
jgi:hypothetical protein